MARSSWTALALVLASQLVLLTRTILAGPPDHARPVFNHTMEAPSFVYCLVPGQFGVTPEMFRARGGIQLLSGSILTPISTNPGRTIGGLYRHRLGWRLYRIAASPNMIPRGGVTSHGYSHSAVGGIVWTQVQAVAYFEEGTQHIEGLTWVANPDYNGQWEGYGLGSEQPLLPLHPWVHEDASMRAFAVAFMDSLVGEANSGLGAERRALLDELLGWTSRREFPLFVPGQGEVSPILACFDETNREGQRSSTVSAKYHPRPDRLAPSPHPGGASTVAGDGLSQRDDLRGCRLGLEKDDEGITA